MSRLWNTINLKRRNNENSVFAQVNNFMEKSQGDPVGRFGLYLGKGEKHSISYWLSYRLKDILSWENNPMKCHHSPGKRFGQKCVTFLTSLVKSHKSPFSVIIRKKNMFFQWHTIQGLGVFVLNTSFSKGIMLLWHAEISISGVLGWLWLFGFGLGWFFWGGKEGKWVESKMFLPNRSQFHDFNWEAV